MIQGAKREGKERGGKGPGPCLCGCQGAATPLLWTKSSEVTTEEGRRRRRSKSEEENPSGERDLGVVR